jgi:type II secretory pathway component PulF
MRLPTTRRRLNWWLPALREAQLANFASSMAVLLRGGVSLPDSLRLMNANYGNDPLGPELERWHQEVAAGETNVGAAMRSSKLLPAMFAWAVTSGGFGRAADIYERRARYHSELMLNILLPVAILVLGGVILIQALPAFRMLTQMLNLLGY